MESGGWEVLMFLVNFRDNYGTVGFKGVAVFGVRDLGKRSSQFGGADVGHDVGVVLEDEDLLG